MKNGGNLGSGRHENSKHSLADAENEIHCGSECTHEYVAAYTSTPL